VDRKAIKKWLLYSGLGLAAMLLQEHLFSRLRVFNVHPMLGGVLTSVVALFEGGTGGAVAGLFMGIMQDASVAGIEGFYSIVYMVCGMAAGMICEYMFRRSLLTAFLWSLIITSITTLLYFLLFFLFTGKAGISALWLTALPEILYSAFMTPIVYFPARFIAGSR